MAGSNGRYTLNFLRTCKPFFQSLCTILYSSQQCMGILVPSHPQWSWVSAFFSFLAILVGTQWYLVVVLMTISLKISGVEQLFIRLIAIHIFFFSEIIVQIFCFFICFLAAEFSECSIFWIQVLTRYTLCKYFLPGCGLSFHPLNNEFQRIEF